MATIDRRFGTRQDWRYRVRVRGQGPQLPAPFILEGNTLTKHIVLRGQPHVEIILTRPPANPEKACQGSIEKGP